MEDSRSYSSIDYFKLFCAFLVVGIHTQPFKDDFWLDSVFGVLTRIAVPFFFVASAFFYSKKEITWYRCFQYCKRILALFVFWSVVYSAIELYKTDQTVREMLIVFVCKGYDHLWYLHASIVAVVLFTVLQRGFGNSRIVLIVTAVVLYLLGTAISTYYPLAEKISFLKAFADSRLIQWFGTRNGLFYGFPYFVMGYCLAEADKEKTGTAANAVFTLVCFALLSLEGLVAVRVLKTNQTILWISAVPLVFFLFRLVLGIQLPKTKWAILSRKCSTLIYCVHPSVIMILSTGISSRPLLCVLTFLISMVAAVIYQVFIRNNLHLPKGS